METTSTQDGRSWPYRDQRESQADRDIADQFAGAQCSLDGQPAIVFGRLNRFASVQAQVCPFSRAEYAWQTVQRGMTTDRSFRL